MTEYLYDHQNPTGYAQVLEEWLDGQLAKSLALGHDVISQWAAGVAGGMPLSLLYDGHGSTRASVDTDDQILSGQVFRYDAYGNRFDAATALTSLLYSGELTDSTGLQYLRARYYDPASGRFNRLDPFAGSMDDPLSLHRYLYVHANPVENIDPTGLFTNAFGFAAEAAIKPLTAFGVMNAQAHVTSESMKRHTA